MNPKILQAVRSAIRRRPQSISELAESIGISETSVARALRELNRTEGTYIARWDGRRPQVALGDGEDAPRPPYSERPARPRDPIPDRDELTVALFGPATRNADA